MTEDPKPKQDPLSQVLAGLQALTEKVEGLAGRMVAVEKGGLPLSTTSVGGDMPTLADVYGVEGEAKVRNRALGNRGVALRFNPGDIVRLDDADDLAQRFRAYLEKTKRGADAETKRLAETQGFRGRVLHGLSVHKPGRPNKYLVQFPGLGTEGCPENTLALVQRA